MTWYIAYDGWLEPRVDEQTPVRLSTWPGMKWRGRVCPAPRWQYIVQPDERRSSGIFWRSSLLCHQFLPRVTVALCEWQLHKLYNICSIVNYEFILMYTIITLLYGPITCHIILSHYDRKLSKIWTRLILNMWPGENRGFTNILWSVNNWHKDHTNVYWPSDVSMGLSYVTISE